MTAEEIARLPDAALLRFSRRVREIAAGIPDDDAELRGECLSIERQILAELERRREGAGWRSVGVSPN